MASKRPGSLLSHSQIESLTSWMTGGERLKSELKLFLDSEPDRSRLSSQEEAVLLLLLNAPPTLRARALELMFESWDSLLEQ